MSPETFKYLLIAAPLVVLAGIVLTAWWYDRKAEKAAEKREFERKAGKTGF